MHFQLTRSRGTPSLVEEIGEEEGMERPNCEAEKTVKEKVSQGEGPFQYVADRA